MRDPAASITDSIRDDAGMKVPANVYFVMDSSDSATICNEIIGRSEHGTKRVEAYYARQSIFTKEKYLQVIDFIKRNGWDVLRTSYDEDNATFSIRRINHIFK